MSKSFKGRAILPGRISGEALVTRQGFNTYACFYNSLDASAKSAVCAHSANDDLSGKNLSGRIICMPQSTGSTSAGAVWQRIVRLGIAPIGLLFSESIDSLAAGGLIVAEIWAGERIITLDQLGREFLEEVKDGDYLTITLNGRVSIN